MPVGSAPNDPDDALGERFDSAVLDLLDVLAERGDRLGLDDDAALGAVADAIERWVSARWADTPAQARPALVVEGLRIALTSHVADHHPGPGGSSPVEDS